MTNARVMQVATSLNSALANYDNNVIKANYYNKTDIDSFNSKQGTSELICSIDGTNKTVNLDKSYKSYKSILIVLRAIIESNLPLWNPTSIPTDIIDVNKKLQISFVNTPSSGKEMYYQQIVFTSETSITTSGNCPYMKVYGIY